MNKKTKKNTVTIAIPAHNEEKNIAYALKSILEQTGELFSLEKIQVLCDGCTDKTAELALKMAESHKNIEVVSDSQRKGKVARLNEAFHTNLSDYLIIFDADIVLASTNVVEEMIKQFKMDPKALLVVAHEIPIKPDNFIGKVIYAGYEIWDMTRLSVKNYDHIQNHYGAASAYPREFAASITIPKTITDERGYLYILAKQREGFRYLMNVHILYRPVGTLNDFWKQSIRSLSKNQVVLAKHFGDRVYDMYNLPLKYKLKAIVKMLLKSPIYTTLSLLLNILIRLFPGKEGLYKEGMWDMTTSTKKAITQN